MSEISSYQEGYTDGFNDARIKYERPQGEWEEPFEHNGKWSGVAVGQNREKGKWIPCYVNFTDGSKPLFAYCKCSLCNKQATGDYKFCPNCGAEMRGGES